jgi:Methyltransferase domain
LDPIRHLRVPRTLTRQYVKLCDVADFGDPQLCAAVGEIEGRPAPRALSERKQWERGMLALALAERGSLHDEAAVLAIGAGTEPVLFWLANRVGMVTATDIYGEGKFAAVEAAESMLANPAAFSPVDYRKDRLVVRHMDARRLEFPTGSFDAVYSLSSIEHFGSPQDIAGRGNGKGSQARRDRGGGHRMPRASRPAGPGTRRVRAATWNARTEAQDGDASPPGGAW